MSAAFTPDHNPWRNDASFDLAFGGLSRFLEETSAETPLPLNQNLSPTRSGKVQMDSCTDPFVLSLQLADQVVDSRRKQRRTLLLQRLRAETAGVFEGKKEEILNVCSTIQGALHEFEQFDSACGIGVEPDAGGDGDTDTSLDILPENQKKMIDLLEFSQLLAQSNSSVGVLQANSMAMVEQLIGGIKQRVQNITGILREIETIEGVQESFDIHINKARFS
jgi:hypothetical protein